MVTGGIAPRVGSLAFQTKSPPQSAEAQPPNPEKKRSEFVSSPINRYNIPEIYSFLEWKYKFYLSIRKMILMVLI
jgi:hypothetical protein